MAEEMEEEDADGGEMHDTAKVTIKSSKFEA